MFWLKNYLKLNRPLTALQKLIRKSSRTLPANVFTDSNQSLKIGEKLHGFEVKNIQDINEFKLTAIHLIHNKTKAEYLHLLRDDPNNVFSINFRTTPMSSNGLPHILEHLTLCGSKEFPVRDPFIRMTTRSLATFLNAMTAPDYTMYPFSSQNLTDYKNLMKVYLDATFQPLLREFDFMQEGWRLEHQDPNNINSDLIIKGVVYNEMKGVFAENENILQQKLQNYLLPDHTYGYVSGGEPLDIPDLTWNDLKQFHKTNYHPSNARFYSYGNFPLPPTLDYLNREYLSKFSYQSSNHTLVPKQKRWTKTQMKNIDCRFGNMGPPIERQNTLSIAYLMSDITDTYETFVLQFISELLIKGPNAALYKSLIEPNFSGGFTPSTGFDTQPRDTVFVVGLQGLKKTDYDRVVKIFDNTIDNVIENGFNDKHIESVLHQIEISLKHETEHFGLNLLFGLSSIWNHEGDIMDALKVEQIINKLKNDLINNKKFLNNKLKKYFKDNTHRLILTMSPDKDYELKYDQMEKNLIDKLTKKFTDNDRKLIYEKNLELQKFQNSKQNIDVLPILLPDDINKTIEKIPKENIIINSTPIQLNLVNSNGIFYFKSLLSTMGLTQEQQMLLPLFCYVITKLGTDKYDYLTFDNLVNTRTNGLNLSPFIGDNLHKLHYYEPGILISSYCLEKNIDKMWDIWAEIFNISHLKDVSRFKMLVELYMSTLTHGLIHNGHKYAIQSCAGIISGTSYQKELLSGLQHICYMKQLIKTENYEAILDEILNIAKIVFNKNNLRSAFNINREYKGKIVTSFGNFLSQIPSLPKNFDNRYVKGNILTSFDSIHCQHHIFNIPVNFCSKSILTVPYSNPDYSALRVLSHLLTTKYLFPEIREKRGAYGCGAKLLSDGVLSFYSYRDSNNLITIDIFDNSYNWLKDNYKNFTEQDLFEAKLGVFQSIDAPKSPSNKGSDEFLINLTSELLQKHRMEILNVNLDTLKNVAEKYLAKQNFDKISKVIIGNKCECIDNNERKGKNEMWTV